MPKRKREDTDYVDFCKGLQKTSKDGFGINSFIHSNSRPVKRRKINPNFYNIRPNVYYHYIYSNDTRFKFIEGLIDHRKIEIDYILSVQNYALEAAYYIKKREKRIEYGNVQELLLFHGTKAVNVTNICTFNFDWRLNGSNTGHKFGKGVCFSASAKYASNYTNNGYNKVMLIAKVLIANACNGNQDMSLPPEGYDTSQKGRDGSVYVKYDDNEFCPQYIVHYHLKHRYKSERRWRFDGSKHLTSSNHYRGRANRKYDFTKDDFDDHYNNNNSYFRFGA